MQNIIDQLQFGTTLECLDPTKNYVFTLHLGCPEDNENIVGGGGLDGYQISLSNIDSLFSGAEFCEAVQDCVGDAIQGFDYNDVINQWLINNPFPITIVSADPGNLITIGSDSGALLTQATINAGTTNVLTSTVNTITSTVNGQVATAPIIDTVVTTTDVNGDLVITINGVASAPIDINPDCADVVTCVESEPSLTLQDVTVNDLTITGDLVIPASELSLTTAVNTATLLVGNQTVTAPIINSNVQSLVGTTLTSTVNGIAAPVDLAPLMNSAVFQSDDDQVLTAGATSDMDVQLVPTTIVDPDSQVNKINYEISVTPKPTVICSGNPLSATNKLLTSDTLTNNVTLPTTVVAAPDPTYSCNSYTLATKVLNGCNEDIYVPVGKTTSLRTLLPSLIVTANPLIPDFNDAGKDYYVTSISYIDNTILSFCPTFYEIRSRGKIYISQPNNDGAVYSSLSGPGAIWYDETVDNYSKDQSYVYVSVPTTTMYQNIFGSINAFHSIRVIVDVGISPVMAGGGFSLDMSQAAMVLMYP